MDIQGHAVVAPRSAILAAACLLALELTAALPVRVTDVTDAAFKAGTVTWSIGSARP